MSNNHHDCITVVVRILNIFIEQLGTFLLNTKHNRKSAHVVYLKYTFE